jgi:hypothetical protein
MYQFQEYLNKCSIKFTVILLVRVTVVSPFLVFLAADPLQDVITPATALEKCSVTKFIFC